MKLITTDLRELKNTITAEVTRLWNDPVSDSPFGRPGPGSMLAAASRLYALGLGRDQERALRERRTLPAFVISVGNIVVGGTGKTPFTLWLARFMSESGKKTAILSRGYGRRGNDVCRVPSGEEARPDVDVAAFGDEPLLMARGLPRVPVWVGRRRVLSGRAAIEESGAEVLLMDDGFQHLALHRDLDIVLLDAEKPFGNGRLLPLGPLREPVEHLDRAHAFVLTRADDPEKTEATRAMLRERFPRKPVFACTHRLKGFRTGPDGPLVPVQALRGRNAAAFAGIAHPESFFRALAGLGINVRATLPFPDHHLYGPSDITRIMDTVRRTGARFLITTEKDMVRLPSHIRSATLAAELDLAFGPESDSLCAHLLNSFSRKQICTPDRVSDRPHRRGFFRYFR